MKIRVLTFLFFTVFLHNSQAGSNLGVDAIYGIDNRLDGSAITEQNLIKLKSAIGLMVSKDQLTKGLLTSEIQAAKMTESVNVCSDVRFANELTIESCTAFLIAPDLMATAGHCIQESIDCENKVIAFDVSESSQKADRYKISNSNLYECQEIVAQSFNESGDYSVFKLKKKTRRTPLKLRTSGEITAKDKVLMLGHPLGQPLKMSPAVTPTDLTNPILFKAPLNSFVGNSGSPVINAKTLKVEGILVNGAEDFLLDEINKCYRFQVHEVKAGSGEGVSRISEILPFLP
jgi:V8-like Glu-specific endopeptidase